MVILRTSTAIITNKIAAATIKAIVICSHVKTKNTPPNVSCTVADVENVDVDVGFCVGESVTVGVGVGFEFVGNDCGGTGV